MLGSTFPEVSPTAQQAKNGVQSARRKTDSIQRVPENAPNRVALAGKDFVKTASRAKAEKYTRAKKSSASATRVAAYGSLGSDPGERSTSRPALLPSWIGLDI